MLLNYITLENIGAYRGINKLDLQVNSEQHNVVLIGGENGAGKTTLLSSLKVGLFGPYAYGYKTENDTYYKSIYKLLNNIEKTEQTPKFSINISFDETINFMKSNYILNRYWKVNSSGKLNEYLEVYKDGSILSNSDTEIFENKLRENIPPQLYDLFLFDGEEISKIINDDLISTYINNVSKTIFNLDLFDALEQDLNNFIIDSTQQKEKDKNIIEQKKLKQVRKKLETEFERLTREIEYSKKNLIQLDDEYIYTKKTFESLGGLKKAQRDEMLKKVNEIDKLRKGNLEEIKVFIANQYPIFINMTLLNSTVEQMSLEESLQIYTQLKSKLNYDLVQSIVTSVPGISNSNETISKLKSGLIDALKPADNHTVFFHRASFNQRSQVAEIQKVLLTENLEYYVGLINENKNLLIESQELRKQIEINDSTSDFKDMLIKMEELQAVIFNIKNNLINLNGELEKIKENIKETDTLVSEKESLIRATEKTQGAYGISKSIIELSQKFKSMQQQKKLTDVQIEATKMLNNLLRKNRYISSIQINHIDYGITLFGNNKQIIDKETLSAGEKQILLLSIIWALFKCSNRKMPIIFDTLLGRLDKTHRKNVITELIPRSSGQVLILSTDTEIDYKYYNLLKDFISKEYVLNFNTEELKIDIQQKYFDFDEVSTQS